LTQPQLGVRLPRPHANDVRPLQPIRHPPLRPRHDDVLPHPGAHPQQAGRRVSAPSTRWHLRRHPHEALLHQRHPPHQRR